MLVNDPPFETTGFGSESLTYYGRWTYKEEIARRKGAAGLILIHTDESAGYGFAVVRSSHTVEQVALEGARSQPLALRAWVTRQGHGRGPGSDRAQRRWPEAEGRPA